MSKDAVFRVYDCSVEHTATIRMLTDDKNTSYTLRFNDQGRMNRSAYIEAINKAAHGGYVLADQIRKVDETTIEASYITVLKSANNKARKVFTSHLTTADIFSKDSNGQRSRVTSPWELQQHMQSQHKITVIATHAKNTPIECHSVDDVKRELSAVHASLKSPSYTAKVLVCPGDMIPDFEFFQVRDSAGGYDEQATLNVIDASDQLKAALSVSPVYIFPAIAIRLSDLSVRSMLDKWFRIRQGAKFHAVEHFFRSTQGQFSKLFGEGVAVTNIGADYEYGTFYRMTSQAKPLRAFLND